MKYGSLFSGIGGFDLGFEQAGLSCLWQVEIDADCHRVLERHWPDVTRYTDVRDVGKLEPVDIICGGFPCQDLSVAGKRAGLAGERSGLWFEFLRIIGLNRPRFIVIENVPGLLSSWSPVELPPDAVEGCEWDVEENSDFEIIVVGLTELGYCVASRILDAQYDGVAQRRERVFIVGSLGDGSCAEILFESESVSWNPPTRGEAGQRVAATVTPRIDSNSRGWSPVNEADNLVSCGEVAPALTSRDRKSTREDIADPAFVVQGTYQNTGHGWWNKSETAQTIRTPEGGGSLEANIVTHALRSEGADASEDGTGRGTPLVVANCFNGYTGGADDNDAQANHIVAFAQNTRDEVRIQGDGKISGALSNQPGMKQQTYIAFSSKDHGADAGEIAPTLRSQNFKDSHINGGGQVAIAFQSNESFDSGASDNVSPTLRIGSNGAGQPPAVAFTERTRAFGPHSECQEELAYAVTNPGKGGRTNNRQIAGQFGVRRLTPRECERLQSFPDDWTRWDANGKEISDSARYRMLGNAVCVNVARWIGKRILEAGS